MPVRAKTKTGRIRRAIHGMRWEPRETGLTLMAYVVEELARLLMAIDKRVPRGNRAFVSRFCP